MRGERARGTPRDGGRPGRRLLVDARGLYKSGIGRYLREVLNGVLADGRFGRVRLLGRPEETERFLAARDLPQVEVVAFPHDFYSPAAQAHWALLGARGILDADAAFFPHYDVPLPPVPAPFVVTVQDLAHFRLPGLFPRWKRALASVVLSRAVRRAGTVLVTSTAVQRDLLARHPETAPRLRRIPLGVDPAPLAPSPEAVQRAGGLQPFLLCVGNRKPHKNLTAAVRVLARLRAQGFPGLRLVIVGQPMGSVDDVHDLAASLGVDDGVTDLGGVDEGLLQALYGAAEVFLFPSLYEGFGLPVLEAMAAGAPVVASDRASVPEVVGDAGLVADPADPDALAAAVRRFLVDAGLREEMVRRGRARAAGLTWEANARSTAEVLWRTATGAPDPVPEA